MPVVLSIFGVAPKGGAATFCYAQFRARKTVGRYPSSSLNNASLCNQPVRFPSDKFSLELQVWHAVLQDEENTQAEADLGNGILRIPVKCPIQSGELFSGQVFTDNYLLDGARSISVDGGGALLTKGFAIDDGLKNVVSMLQRITDKNEVSGELDDLCKLISREADLDELAKKTPKLGMVEYLRRIQPHTNEPPVFITLNKPDVCSQDPCKEIILTRSLTAPAAALRILLIAKSLDAVVVYKILEIPSGQNEIKVDTGAHITSLSITVYDSDTGDLIDSQEQRYIQNFATNLVFLGKDEKLPLPFKGGQTASDLISRPRFTVSTFSPNPPGRAGGFDVLRANTQLMESLVGTRDWKAETRYFPASQQAQVDVIRWIKQCIEKPETAQVFLIDPYLGRDALERVLFRQGNQSVKMTILVSPGNIDPDAKSSDTVSAPGQHVQNLVKKADSLADKLCGEIDIFHVKRGNDKRPAFHDRHLGLIGRNGIPRVFLLSNSLNKAAGDWPFTVAEVDTLTSRQITLYVENLLAGKEENGKQIETTLIWRSAQPSENQQSATSSQATTLSLALNKTYRELFKLNETGKIADREKTDPVVDEMLLTLPKSFDSEKLAEAIVQSVLGRDHLLPAIIQRLSESPDHVDTAVFIEEKMAHRLLERLTLGSSLFGQPEMLSVLFYVGNIISRKKKGTDFLRKYVNPLLDKYANTLEFGNVKKDSFKMLIAGLCLVVTGLELVRVGEGINTGFRNGIAIDYIHFLGRLLSSFASQAAFGEQMKSFPGEEIAFEALKVAKELALSLEPTVRSAMDLLIHDTQIPVRFSSAVV